MSASLRQWSARRVVCTVVATTLVGALLTPVARGADTSGPQGAIFTTDNESGKARTINVAGVPVVADTNPFFQDLGANGRRCVTCHEPKQNMGVSAAGIRARFEATGGTDPIFRTNDGSNSPLADVSTVDARRAAYNMLLTKGLIRVGISIPADAEFELAAVHDPYGYAGNNANHDELSLFRRPLPSTNLAFLTAVMWDGRETFQNGTSAAIHFDLADQSNGATTGHAQAPSPIDQATRDAIVGYETSLYTAQVFDRFAGDLRSAGAEGGPEALSLQPFVFGENDPFGCDANGANCNPANGQFNPVFTEYDAWAGLKGGGRNQARASVARGQDLFNNLVIPIKDVPGINDELNVAVFSGRCTTCHDTPHAGDHSVPAPLNIGLVEPPVNADGTNVFGLPVGDMPVYTLRHKVSGATKVVTDPGRALITGKWKDVGRFKGPILRGLVGRAPYFHNGTAATLADAVSFYDRRFELNLTQEQKDDLVAFLRSL
jgi:cytochrome c peroxidase